MSDAVVVVGPTAVSGPGAVDLELAATALDCIDDELALVGDRAVSVDELWRDVLGSATAGACAELVLICPSWWSRSRVARICAAGGQWSPSVVVLRRSEALATGRTLVEVAPELVVVHADPQRHAIPRTDASAGVLDAVAARVDGLSAVTVDIPSGHASFGNELDQVLRRRGIDVTVVDDRTLVATTQAPPGADGSVATPRDWRPTPRAAAVAVALLSMSVLAAAAVGLDDSAIGGADTTWLVEGSVALEVPTRWSVERVTSGPGSARVQLVSPTNPSDVLHVTQSVVPDAQTLAGVAETLRAALVEQPEGVFVDFTAEGERAHRPAVTYSEIRAGRRIDWTVLLDGGLRIAIGCEGAAQVCDEAIGSARAVARK